jgi:hypothetical protein
MHVANIPAFEAPHVYLPIAISVMILHAATKIRDAMCISLAQCVRERWRQMLPNSGDRSKTMSPT